MKKLKANFFLIVVKFDFVIIKIFRNTSNFLFSTIFARNFIFDFWMDSKLLLYDIENKTIFHIFKQPF